MENTQETTLKPQPERKFGTINGEVVLGKVDPRTLTKEQFEESQDLLFHGAAKEFSYSPIGEYDVSATGGDGTTDYGFGFYTTDNSKQAENYSAHRSRYKLSELVVYSFLPNRAKMLDVRDAKNPNTNGVLPRDFVEKWNSFLKKHNEDDSNYPHFNDFLKKMQKRGVQEHFLDRHKKDLENNKDIKIRVEDGEVAGIFGAEYNGVIDIAFQEFMLAEGYDGVIYREGGEGEKGEPLTGYIYYNPSVVDTYEGWQSRKAK